MKIVFSRSGLWPGRVFLFVADGKGTMEPLDALRTDKLYSEV